MGRNRSQGQGELDRDASALAWSANRLESQLLCTPVDFLPINRSNPRIQSAPAGGKSGERS
jgi:hypothetical protein